MNGDRGDRPPIVLLLDSDQADYGGHAGSPGNDFAGASAGCAAVSGAIMRLAIANPELGACRWLQQLREGATYRGPERRQPSMPSDLSSDAGR